MTWKGYCLTDEEARDGLPELGAIRKLHLLDADVELLSASKDVKGGHVELNDLAPGPGASSFW